MSHLVTFTITSCNRLDLLEKTLNSFFKLNKYQIDEFILSDDSADFKSYERIVDMVGENFKIIKNESRLGLSKSLDNLFSLAKNEYIFHCEDDWFFEGNPNFISESLSILEDNKDIHQVYIRHRNDYYHPTEDVVLETFDYVKYKILTQNYKTSHNQTWNGYSWNPGLRRKSDYLKMFPKGISNFGDEYLCSDYTRNFNYCAASLENTSCYHIGHLRTKDFKI